MKRIFTIIFSVSIILLIISNICLIKKTEKISNKTSNEVIHNNCHFKRTYKVEAKYESNDENYIYVTLSAFQFEDIATVKINKPKNIDIEEQKWYEFEFNQERIIDYQSTDNVFRNSKLLKIEYTDKIGLEQVNEQPCN